MDANKSHPAPDQKRTSVCACGCGTIIVVQPLGRPRRYAEGHKPSDRRRAVAIRASQDDEGVHVTASLGDLEGHGWGEQYAPGLVAALRMLVERLDAQFALDQRPPVGARGRATSK